MSIRSFFYAVFSFDTTCLCPAVIWDIEASNSRFTVRLFAINDSIYGCDGKKFEENI